MVDAQAMTQGITLAGIGAAKAVMQGIAAAGADTCAI